MRTSTLPLCVAVVVVCTTLDAFGQQTNRVEDGLIGLVSTVVYKDGSTVTYDTTGRRLSFVRNFLGELRSKDDYKYDADGRIVEMVTTDRNGSPESRMVYSYAASNLSEERHYSFDGTLVSRKQFTYDTSGRKVS